MKTLLLLILVLFCLDSFGQRVITAKKTSDSTMVVRSTDTTSMVATYRTGYLKTQRKSIVASKQQFDSLRNIEIAQIDSLLIRAKNLGIK